MPNAGEAACRESLRCAGLPGQGPMARLLALLRAAPETHLGLAQVLQLAAKAGLIVTPMELASLLKMLTDHGLTERSIPTPRRKAWTAMGVRNILNRTRAQ
jgi:hypothetical protein